MDDNLLLKDARMVYDLLREEFDSDKWRKAHEDSSKISVMNIDYMDEQEVDDAGARKMAHSFDVTKIGAHGRGARDLFSFEAVPQPPNCRKDVRKRMYDFSRMYADVRIFGGLRGVGPAIFLAFACRGGAASTEIASWGAAGCPAIGAGRPDKWAEGTKGGGGGHATRCGSRAHVVICINSKLAIGWLLFFV